jgi:hypothetical protein
MSFYGQMASQFFSMDFGSLHFYVSISLVLGLTIIFTITRLVMQLDDDKSRMKAAGIVLTWATILALAVAVPIALWPHLTKWKWWQKAIGLSLLTGMDVGAGYMLSWLLPGALFCVVSPFLFVPERIIQRFRKPLNRFGDDDLPVWVVVLLFVIGVGIYMGATVAFYRIMGGIDTYNSPFGGGFSALPTAL